MRFKDILTAVRDPDGREDPNKIRAAIGIENDAIASGRARRDAAEFEQDHALLDGDVDRHRKLAGEIAEIDFREKTARERLPLLAERLRIADQIKLAAAIKSRRAEMAAMYAKVRAALENLVEVNVAAIALFELCRNEFGERETTVNFARIHFPGLALPDMASSWIAEMDRAMAPPVASKPQPTPPRRAAVDSRRIFADRDKLRTVDNAHRPTNLNDTPPTPPRSPRSVPAAGPRDGTRIQILKSGVEIGGRQAVAGEELVLEPEAAMALLRAGAADIVAGGPHA